MKKTLSRMVSASISKPSGASIVVTPSDTALGAESAVQLKAASTAISATMMAMQMVRKFMIFSLSLRCLVLTQEHTLPSQPEPEMTKPL